MVTKITGRLLRLSVVQSTDASDHFPRTSASTTNTRQARISPLDCSNACATAGVHRRCHTRRHWVDGDGLIFPRTVLQLSEGAAAALRGQMSWGSGFRDRLAKPG